VKESAAQIARACVEKKEKQRKKKNKETNCILILRIFIDYIKRKEKYMAER
jgi:hypothetical protein